MPVSNPSAGTTAATWVSLANLNAAASVTVIGTPYRATAEVTVHNGDLKFRGNLNVAGGTGSGTRVFDLPASIAAPSVQYRMNVQTGGDTTVGLNIKTDRTVETSGTTGSFLILDNMAVFGYA